METTCKQHNYQIEMQQLPYRIFHLLIGLLITIIVGLSSCNTNSTDNKNTVANFDTPQTKQIGDIVGQLYFYGPELDSVTCKATGSCDCCTSNLLFLNDSAFVALDYCIGGNTYYKGTYKIDKNSITFKSDSLRVDIEDNWQIETDTTGKNLPASFIKVRKDRIFDFKWTSFYFRNRLCFKTSFNEYSTPDNDSKQNFITAANADSIWIKLMVE